MRRFDHEDELAGAITSGAVARHCADADGHCADADPSRVGVCAAVGNVNRNASGLERAAKRNRLLAAAASLAVH